MKKTTAILIASLLTTPSIAQQYGGVQSGPSLGLHVESERLGGTWKETDGYGVLNRTMKGRAIDEEFSIGADLRIPTRQMMALEFDVDYVQREQLRERENNLYRSNPIMDGFRYRIGVRFFLD